MGKKLTNSATKSKTNSVNTSAKKAGVKKIVQKKSATKVTKPKTSPKVANVTGNHSKYEAAIAHRKISKWAAFISKHAPAKVSHPGFSTNSIHCGQPPEAIHGAVNVPIYNSTTFAQDVPGQLKSRYDYSRCGNPTQTAFSDALCSLDYGKHGMVFSSGCGATTTLMTLLMPGDHLLYCDDVYGGTNRLINKVLTPQYNFQADYVDLTNLNSVRKAIKPNTRMMWVETPTNPTLKVCDIEELGKICKKNNIIMVCDNTFGTPYLQSPLLLGADVVYHSCTKYINGHSDVVAGAITTNNQELYERINFIAKTMGVNLGVLDTYLLLRGMKTLKLRMDQCNHTAGVLANYLEEHPMVTKVSYPGLKSHPQHDIAKKQMRGFGGMITFFIKGGSKQSFSFLSSLKVFILAESLGGVESLAECPAVMTHGSVPAHMRKMLGIDESLIRLSVGMEDTEDILSDVEQALEKAKKAK